MLKLSKGTHLGPYEILAPAGSGGMGEVYKAQDSRLNRFVAIKVLPGHISDQPDVRQRFEAEARAIASLNHPHICSIYDVGRQDGADYLVMEFLDGETLEARLSRGPLTLDQVLRYAMEIAGALDKAHRQGIVHRDLKPGNIMLTASGSKLLDFGLAKLSQPAVGLTSNSNLPTNVNLTAAGTILGTLQYMAPEQLEGKDADARTDIFGFGSTVYEMATGKKAFEGKSQVSLMAAILEHDAPRISSLQPVAPKLLDNVVSKCLQKDPNQRWQTAEALMDALKWLSDVQNEKVPVDSAPPRGRRLMALAMVVAGVGLALLGAEIGSRWTKPVQSSAPAARFSVSAPNGQPLLPVVSVSPDGRWLTLEDSAGNIWLRPTDSMEAHKLAGTAGSSMFWSPDSKQLAFFADGKVKTSEVSTGITRALTDTTGTQFGGDWSQDGVIIFGTATGIYKVASGGGVSAPVALKDGAALESPRFFPRFLPDGEHFLYSVPKGNNNGLVGASQEVSIHVASIKSLETSALFDCESVAQYVAPGYVLFVKGDALYAQPFDSAKLSLTGQPQPLAQAIASSYFQPFFASMNGVLVFQIEPDGIDDSDLVWLDKRGKEIGKLRKPSTGTYANPSVAPDGRRVAVNSVDPRSHKADIWIVDGTSGVSERLTLGSGSNSDPVWSPDGQQIAFVSDRDKHFGLYVKSVGGATAEQMLSELPVNSLPTDWSPDGKFIVYGDGGAGKLFRFSLSDRKSTPLLPNVDSGQYGARLSHDGKWIAYASNESGRWEVYIQDFPELTLRHQISDAGGTHPRWGKDDNELYYHSLFTGKPEIHVALLRRSGLDLTPETPRLAFDRTVPSVLDGRNQYTITPDGQRFLIRQPAVTSGIPSVTVMIDWLAALHK